MKPLRFAMIGAGFWSQYQMAGWLELTDVECVAVCDQDQTKAKSLADRFEIESVNSDADQMFDQESLDFVDIVTNVESHGCLVEKAARRHVPVICQKPMAPTLEEARTLTELCAKENTPFYVHENWRWQAPIREVKRLLDSGVIGDPFRAKIQFCSSFPVFDNQPFLRDLDQFILADVGSHILDAARFLFGEARSLHCRTHRVRQDIRGEDVATVMMTMGLDVTVVCEMSYASRLERERFPETFILVEGDKGSFELAPDLWVRITTEEGTHSRRCLPKPYDWVNPDYVLVHSSIVECHRNLLQGLQGQCPAETDSKDNLKTMELVFDSYRSASLL